MLDWNSPLCFPRTHTLPDTLCRNTRQISFSSRHHRLSCHKYQSIRFPNKAIYIRMQLCFSLHFSLSSLNEASRFLCILFGSSHLAPEVSIGLWCKYSASHLSRQSHTNGFLAKCLCKMFSN